MTEGETLFAQALATALGVPYGDASVHGAPLAAAQEFRRRFDALIESVEYSISVLEEDRPTRCKMLAALTALKNINYHPSNTLRSTQARER